MTEHHSTPNPLCRRFQRDLYHFQAGELPESERRILTEHVESCAACARRLELEDGFLRGLKTRLTRAEAPPELRARVHRALEQAAEPRTSSWAWLRTPWLVPAAAALLLALLLVPTLPPGVGDGLHVEREVTVVDIDCEAAGKTIAEQRDCAHPLHLNALRVGTDRYWAVSVQQELGRRMVADARLRGHRLSVVGDLYPALRTLQVASYVDHDHDGGLSARRGGGSVLPARSLPEL